MPALVFVMYIDTDRCDRVNWLKYPSTRKRTRHTQIRGQDRQRILLVHEKTA
jgi:hypothetical protein